MNTWTGPDRGGGAPSLRAAWQILADGLIVQRLHLHVEEWREVVQKPGNLPDISGAPAIPLGQRPSHTPCTEAQVLLERAGLTYWWTLPQLHGLDRAPDVGPTQHGSEQAAQRLITNSPVTPWTEAVIAACEASAWWVGFFAVIRHRGVRHLSLEPNPAPIHAQVLVSAARAVAFGASTRVLGAKLRGSDDAVARRAYCEVITAGIEVERTLPTLLDELGELRLVDLVSTTVPWRGQFSKYAGGTGAGQVE